MKILCIPDPHQTLAGLDYAKAHIGEVDKIVCLGDYVDNWDSDMMWLTKFNPLKIIGEWAEFQKANPEKVILLLGNHDFSYLSEDRDGQNVSGHQWIHHAEIRNKFCENINSFQVAVKLDDWVLSHAGFSKLWVAGHVPKENDPVEWCNEHLKAGKISYFDWCGLWSGSGDEPQQTPTWIRPNSLLKEMFFPKQVVGHTEFKYPPAIMRPFKKDGEGILIAIDSGEHNCYYTLDTTAEIKGKTIAQLNKEVKKKEKCQAEGLAAMNSGNL